MATDWKQVAKGAGSASVLLAALVGIYEGTRYIPYKDVTGVWTNCSGNTHGVDPNKVYTEQECIGINAKQEEQAFTYLYITVHVPLNRNQSVAFADFIYNEGVGTFQKSSMLRDINSGHIEQGCADLKKYIYGGGKILPGLVKRREAEYEICIAQEEK